MANALGGLFSEIAGAIREKTGEVGTMKPAKFPEKIKAISTVKNQDKTITENGTYSADNGYTGLGTVTVDVAGAGGGSLPSGGYWEQLTSVYPTYGNMICFIYDGNQYAVAKKTSTASKFSIYRYDGNVLTLVSADTIYNSPQGYNIIEHNNKVHFIGGYGNYHHIFDGTTVTKLNDLPVVVYPYCTFIINEDLYIVGNSSPYGTYKWDNSADTWTTVTISGIDQSPKCFNYNGDTYLVKETFVTSKFIYDLYKIDVINGALIYIAELPDFYFDYVVIGNYLYYKKQMVIYKIDLKTYEQSAVCNAPANGYLYNHNGKLGMFGTGDYSRNINLVLYEVTE